jgi:hypothetical protein
LLGRLLATLSFKECLMSDCKNTHWIKAGFFASFLATSAGIQAQDSSWQPVTGAENLRTFMGGRSLVLKGCRS